MAPYYAKAEYEMGTTGTNGIERLPGNNNFKVLEAGAKKLGYKKVSYWKHVYQLQTSRWKNSCQQIGFCFQGCKSGAKWSTLYVCNSKRRENW